MGTNTHTQATAISLKLRIRAATWGKGAPQPGGPLPLDQRQLLISAAVRRVWNEVHHEHSNEQEATGLAELDNGAKGSPCIHRPLATHQGTVPLPGQYPEKVAIGPSQDKYGPPQHLCSRGAELGRKALHSTSNHNVYTEGGIPWDDPAKDKQQGKHEMSDTLCLHFRHQTVLYHSNAIRCTPRCDTLALNATHQKHFAATLASPPQWFCKPGHAVADDCPTSIRTDRRNHWALPT